MVNKQKFCLKCLTVLAASIVLLSTHHAYTQNNVASVPQLILPSLSWANQPWTGDNRPYHAIRIQVDHLAEQGKLTPSMLQANFKAWQQTPRDPLKLFQWAYADSMAVRYLPNLPPRPQPGDGAFEACPDPHTYDYERVRFLLNWETHENALLPLAKRLLQHDPKDYPVQYALAGRYGGRDTPAEKAASLARAQRLLAQYPHKPEIYSLIAGIYCDHWIFQKNKEDARKAIFYYQKYLQIASVDNPWRKQASFWVATLTRSLEKS